MVMLMKISQMLLKQLLLQSDLTNSVLFMVTKFSHGAIQSVWEQLEEK